MASKILTLASIAAIALAAAPVAAMDEVPSMTIKHSDLDLARADHQAKLDRRINAAVTQVCGQTSARTLSLNEDIRACREAAFANAKRASAQAIARAEQQRTLALRETAIVGN